MMNFLKLLSILIFILILSSCSNSNQEDSSESASSDSKRIVSIEENNKDEVEFHSLIELCKSKHATIELVNKWLNMGININAKDNGKREWTALHWASSLNEKSQLISVLLKAGADICAKGTKGWTPFHCVASSNPNYKILSTLLESGHECVDVNSTTDGGMTSLHCAAIANKNPDIVSFLLKEGANVHAKDESGSTPLHIASWSPQVNPEVILILINAGSDPKAKNLYGETPLYFARQNSALKGTNALHALEEATK